jgi:hypothetical protein
VRNDQRESFTAYFADVKLVGYVLERFKGLKNKIQELEIELSAWKFKFSEE